MELFLNAVWLGIAGAALLSLLRQSRSDRRQLWLACGALFCATALLFPSISASDDIHAQAFIAEDSTLAKRLGASQTAPNPLIPVCLFTALLLYACATCFERLWRVLSAQSIFYRTPLFNRHLLGRAPPAISAQ